MSRLRAMSRLRRNREEHSGRLPAPPIAADETRVLDDRMVEAGPDVVLPILGGAERDAL
jgi:hypothetical protein